eukprot:2669605-Rhodomonas_salina.3
MTLREAVLARQYGASDRSTNEVKIWGVNPAGVGHAGDARVRGGDLLHHVQPHQDRRAQHPGL